MNTNLTELVLILDRSGSMAGLESDTIGGFNSMIERQKKEEGEAFVSTVLFDDVSEVVYDRVDIKKVEKMTDKMYYVRGCTALLDAVGDAIKHIKNIHKYAREEDRPGKTLFIITTDGYENASKKYTYDKIKQMIETQKEKDSWEFLFLGANIDAVSVAGKMGIDRSSAVEYECDDSGIEVNFEALGSAISNARKARSGKQMRTMFASAEWKESIEADYAKRHK